MQRVGVVDGGLKGAGIAEVSARLGASVIVVEATEVAAQASRGRFESSLRRSALADRELVIEAIVEDEQAKVGLFTTLDEIVVARGTSFASNTSSIPIMKLGVVTSRIAQVVGGHFFNPVRILQLVELVPSLLTSDDTTTHSWRFVEGSLGKRTIDCQGHAGIRGQRVAHPVHPLRDPDVRVRVPLREGHRSRPGARRRAPAGTSGAGRPNRPGHHQDRPVSWASPAAALYTYS